MTTIVLSRNVFRKKKQYLKPGLPEPPLFGWSRSRSRFWVWLRLLLLLYSFYFYGTLSMTKFDYDDYDEYDYDDYG